MASGVVGLWLREGCGVGPNLHSIVTSIGVSATAGIANRMTPCSALRLYPGLQTPVLSTTYRRPPHAPRQVLLQQGNPISHSEIKIEKLGGTWPDISSLLSPPSLKTSTIPGRLAFVYFCSWGREPGVPIHRQRVRRGLTAALLRPIKFPRVLFRERGVD